MAKIKTKLKLSGRIGDMVICNGKKRSYLRSLPTTVAEASSTQLEWREKMKLATPFVRAMKPILDLFWRRRSDEEAPYHQLLGIILKSEFLRVGSELKLNFPSISLSRGNLLGVLVKNALLKDNVLKIDWEIFQWNTPANSEHHLLNIVFYNEDFNVASVFTGIARRFEKTLELRLAKAFESGRNHFWILSSNQDGTNFSESLYLEIQKINN